MSIPWVPFPTQISQPWQCETSSENTVDRPNTCRSPHRPTGVLRAEHSPCKWQPDLKRFFFPLRDSVLGVTFVLMQGSSFFPGRENKRQLVWNHSTDAGTTCNKQHKRLKRLHSDLCIEWIVCLFMFIFLQKTTRTRHMMGLHSNPAPIFSCHSCS